jgi:hypothetical protein
VTMGGYDGRRMAKDGGLPEMVTEKSSKLMAAEDDISGRKWATK